MVEEFLLVDTSGRVQIPREMIDELKLGERLRVEIVDGRVTLRDIDADDTEKKQP